MDEVVAPRKDHYAELTNYQIEMSLKTIAEFAWMAEICCAVTVAPQCEYVDKACGMLIPLLSSYVSCNGVWLDRWFDGMILTAAGSVGGWIAPCGCLVQTGSTQHVLILR
jgi:hypothetical protein